MAPIQTKKQKDYISSWIYEDENNFPHDRDYMAFLQRVRDMLNEFQFNCPVAYQRFRRAGQAPRGVGKKKTKKNKKQKKKQRKKMKV